MGYLGSLTLVLETFTNQEHFNTLTYKLCYRYAGTIENEVTYKNTSPPANSPDPQTWVAVGLFNEKLAPIADLSLMHTF
jgi:hypothetical protein